MSLYSLFLVAFTSFFAVMNPLANTPIFIALTHDLKTKREKQMVAGVALLLSFFVVSIFAFFGKNVLLFFHITLSGLRLAGGVILFFIGYDMLKGKHPGPSEEKNNPGDTSSKSILSIAISPLGIPLLAGPGAVTVALSYVDITEDFLDSLVVSFSFFLLCVVTYFFFMAGERFIRIFGESVINGITRFMGMIVASLGAQMLINFMKHLFHL